MPQEPIGRENGLKYLWGTLLVLAILFIVLGILYLI